MTSSPTSVYTLKNNLKVIMREAHSAPVATCWLWYRVGSRNEISGHTGISHWVEHMLFKGTPSIPVGELDLLVARNGGTFNGYTGIDYTAYYETLPADRIEIALQIESDRMVNALFDLHEVENERTVILAELEGDENYPETWLDEAVKAAAFTAHPYHYPVIGLKSDIMTMTREDLYVHYQTYYMPNNAVLVLVGDFATDTIRERVEHYFADLPIGPPFRAPHAVEPEPQGERVVYIRRPGAAAYIQVAFLAPDCRSADFAPMLVLDAVLSGAKPFTAFGDGAQTNRSARMYQELVETGLASSATSYFHPTYDPFLFELYATVNANSSVSDVEAALMRQIYAIQQDGISQAELHKVIKQVQAQVVYGSESVTNQALLLGMWEMLDSYTRADALLDEIAAVCIEDVQRVAQTYLVPHRCTMGHFIPTE